MKLSHGDSVVIISGKDKGKKGTVMRVLGSQDRVLVSGVNMVTKHIKKTAQTEGKKVRFEASIHVSNVQIADPKTGKPSRIGFVFDASGKKLRIAKKSGTTLSRTRQEVTASKEEKVPTSKGAASEAPKKKGFWKHVGFGADAGDAARADAGPAHAAVPTRSAGRGS